AVLVPSFMAAQRRGDPNPFPGGTNADGSLRPTPPLTRLFTQDAYTEYAILAPGSEQFRIQFIPEDTRAGATELVNATRGASEGRLKLAFANPSGQSNPVTIHARRTTATFPPLTYTDMFFDDVKTLYDLDPPESGRIRVEQTYSDYRKGPKATLDALAYLPL